jgi:hypothetical protein
MSQPLDTRRGAAAALALLAALCLPPATYAQRDAGVVIDIAGHWVLGGTGELSRGQRVPAGGRVSVVSPTEHDYIVIANLNGDVMESRRCRNPGECDRPMNLPGLTRARPSTFRVILDAGMRLLLGRPNEFSRHGSRGVEPLPDGVVQLSSGKVALAPLFRGKDRGTYYVRLRPAAAGATPQGWAGPFALDWGPRARGTVAWRDLRPGLYEVDLMDAKGSSSLADDDYAWVLVESGREYRAARSSFEQARALTRKWGREVSDEASMSFLRAYLKHLAEPPGR